LPIGLQAAQAGHGIVEFALQYPELTREWHDKSNYIVILAVDDEEELLHIMQKAEARGGMRFAYFNEPDLDDEITAVVLEPGLDSRKLSGNLKLVGR
tara:strand:+ start:231 stop:521 length:291 start_codon:yes stop_codon:yes gene_type:complete